MSIELDGFTKSITRIRWRLNSIVNQKKNPKQFHPNKKWGLAKRKIGQDQFASKESILNLNRSALRTVLVFSSFF